MTRVEQIHNWLMTGLQQSDSRISEIFYYDKRDNEFFSILITDYFLFDENWNVPGNVTTTYTKQNINDLADRLRRIESGDNTIISLPRLGNMDSENLSQQLEEFLSLNSIVTDTATIWEVESSGSITFNNKKSWWKFWK